MEKTGINEDDNVNESGNGNSNHKQGLNGGKRALQYILMSLTSITTQTISILL